MESTHTKQDVKAKKEGLVGLSNVELRGTLV
jgi:hypothetical protein